MKKIIEATEYNYKELINQVRENETPETLAELGYWFEHYGSSDDWNGEYWDCELGRLYPIYGSEQDGCYPIVGWEIK